MFYVSGVTTGLSIIVERMILSDHKQRPSAEKILSYQSLKEISKRDNKLPRTDFAVSSIFLILLYFLLSFQNKPRIFFSGPIC